MPTWEDYARINRIWEDRKRKAREQILEILKSVNPNDRVALLKEILREVRGGW
jgi:hypothetical protein